MITLPPQFTATKYPGYFWDVDAKALYSLKPSGVLHKVPLRAANHWNKGHAGYQISHNGQRRTLYHEQLLKLQLTDSVIPIETDQ